MATKNKAIVVKNLSKSFNIPLEYSNGIKQKIINLFKGIKGYRVFTPLSNISFEIEEGDFFGIVGRNGSGKSTLLKTIAGIYSSDKGSIKVNGSLVPFIELGVGFNPELTGRENVFLNGALLGFSRKEMESMYSEIVDFAELNEFMDEKLKNYSSGMQVRLAFSIAIQAKGDILLLDEVLAVGDEAFQRKCFNYFAELKREKKTVVLVTHDMDTVQRFCNKAIMIDKGEIVRIGNPSKVAQLYRDSNSVNVQEESKNSKKDKQPILTEYAEIKSAVKVSDNYKEIIVSVNMRALRGIEDGVITLEISQNTGLQVYRWVSDEKIIGKNISLKKDDKINLNLTIQNIFPDGVFTGRVALKKRDRTKEYARVENAITFEIVHKNSFPYDTQWKPSESVSLKSV